MFLKSIVEYLSSWSERMTLLVTRFTGDRDVTVIEDMVQIRRVTQSWIESGSKLLTRNEKTTNGKDYVQASKVLSDLTTQIEEWMNKLEMRISGDDGTAAQVITLQNQIDDRCVAFSAKDTEKPLPESDRAALKEYMRIWSDMIGNLISKNDLI